MAEQVSREERARQVSEALHRLCQAHDIRIAVFGDVATVFGDFDDEHGALFQFQHFGYEQRTADEVTISA